jgi:hypothetical protein
MGREYDVERLFSQQIDRLLAGEEVSKDPAMNDDLTSALEFAQKMIDLRATPSPQFASGLKSGLLQKLAEQEESRAAGQGWFQRLMPRTPVFQAVAVLAAVFIISGILWATLFRPSPVSIVQAPTPTPPVTWGSPVIPATTAPPATAAPATTRPAPTIAATTTSAASATPAPVITVVPATITPAPSTQPAVGKDLYLRSSAVTNKSAYLPGEQVQIQVNLKNISSQTVVLENYPPSISLMSADSKQPVYTVNSGSLVEKIAPGQTGSYVITWDQTDEKGRRVSPGSYYLELEEVYRQGVSVSLALPNPVYFQILPSSAAGGDKRFIDVIGQSLTVNGITFTLEQIQVNAGAVSVTGLISPPPDYVLKEDSSGLSTSIDYRIQARYSFDGSWFEKTGPSFVEYYADGMKHTWSIPAANPAGSENLTLVIDDIAGWAGPWEFSIKIK